MIKRIFFSVLVAFPLAGFADEQPAIKDGGLIITKPELSAVAEWMPEDVKKEVAEDVELRRNYLSQIVAMKKMVTEVDKISVNDDPAFYWKVRAMMDGVKIRLLTERYLEKLSIPDMSKLAEERYLLEKERYAKVPEVRESSHIFLRCMREENCNFGKRRQEATKIIAELQGGNRFSSMVEKYSEDPGSKVRKGRLKNPVALSSKGIAKEYLNSLFKLEKKHQYTLSPVATKFGYHIIRLDKITPEYFRPYEDVKDTIIKSLEKEYRSLSAEVYRQGFNLADDAYVDEKFVDKMFESLKEEGTKKVDKP